MIQPISDEDILLWADGNWCYRHEYNEVASDRSDDFEVIPQGSTRYDLVAAT